MVLLDFTAKTVKKANLSHFLVREGGFAQVVVPKG